MGRVQKLLKAARAHENFLNIQVKLIKEKGHFSLKTRKVAFDIWTLNQHRLGFVFSNSNNTWIFSFTVFFHRHWRFTGQQGKGGDKVLILSTTATRSQKFKHLQLFMWDDYHVSYCVAYNYLADTVWDLLPLREKCRNTELFLARIWTLFT